MNIFKYIIPVAIIKKLYKNPDSYNNPELSDEEKDAIEDAKSDKD